MSNAPQYSLLFTVTFTNLLVLSNTLAAIYHRIAKALYKKKSLTKSKKVCGHSPPPPGELPPRQLPPLKFPKEYHPWTFSPEQLTG